MVTRFERIIEVAGSLVALDAKGQVWIHEPAVEITVSPWRRILSPGEEPPPERRVRQRAGDR